MKVKKYRISIFIIFIYLFCFQTPLTNILPFFRYWDELFALLSFIAFIMYSIKYKMPLNRDTKGIFLFLCFGFVGAIINDYQSFTQAVFPDLFLCSKFWLVFFCGKYVLSRDWQIGYKEKIIVGRHAAFITCLLFVLSIADLIFDIYPAISYRYGLKSINLFYNHPTNLVSISCLLICLLFMSREYNKRWQFYNLMLLVIMALTFRIKAFAIILCFVLLWYFIIVREKKVDVKSLLLFVPLVVLIGWEQIQYYFISVQETSARYALLVTALEIAKDYLPLGTGFGTFASAFSADPYSPVYGLYGISSIHGLTSANPSFISDSFWPMIIGQTGILGFISYIYLLYGLLKKIQRLRFNKNYYMAALFAFVYLMVSSTSEAAFVSPNSIPMALVLGLLANQYELTDNRRY